MSYSSAKGVATAHATAVCVEGRDPYASSELNGLNSRGPSPAPGRARPTTYFKPSAATPAVVPASTAENPVRERRGSLPSSASTPAAARPNHGMLLAMRDPCVTQLLDAWLRTWR